MQFIWKILILYPLIALYYKTSLALKHHSMVLPEEHRVYFSKNHLEQHTSQPNCMLGNDTYQFGERWNPNLPPFGVQVCVQCECVVRQRKSCFETKVTCRRITNECPIIDSCPDGKKPVTTAGQCCKSCQSDGISTDNTSITSIGRQFHEPSQSPPPPPLNDRLMLYNNERIKEYQSIVKNLQPCQRRDGEKHTHSVNPVKTLKGNKNDLNGIDSRLAFKSLHDSQNNYISPSSSGSSNSATKTRNIDPKPADDIHRHDHQLPNDIQSGAASGHNLNQTPNTEQTSQPNCKLGNDTYQFGDRWNPILPPFGVQVCVQCECLIRQRKSCFETKVTCRRINNECQILESCPDGKKPVTIAGQCCKSCQSDGLQLPSDTGSVASRQGSTALLYKLNPVLAQDDRMMLYKDERIREYQSIVKSLQPCQKRDGEKQTINLANERRASGSNAKVHKS